MVRDLDLVIRPKQSSLSSVGDPSAYKCPLRKPLLGCATMATAAVPPAELAMVSTRSVREKVFLLRLFLWSVMTKRPLEKPVLPKHAPFLERTGSVFGKTKLRFLGSWLGLGENWFGFGGKLDRFLDWLGTKLKSRCFEH